MTQDVAPCPPPAMPVLTPDMDFDAASHLVLQYLEAHVPMALWAVTRVENERQTFIQLNATDAYAVQRGGSVTWQDSYCYQMVSGLGPTVAPDAQSVPAYAASTFNDTFTVGAYAGSPIHEPSGSVFGVLCGVDPTRKSLDGELSQAAPLLALLGQLLSMVLAADRTRDESAYAVFEATLAAETDALTGLFNLRAWQRILAEEQERFDRFADPTVAVVLDLDLLKTVNDTQGHEAGDRYIQLAASALSGSVKDRDVVARLGGDEFAVLLRGCTEAEAVHVVDRIYAALADVGVAGSIGWAPISVLRGFPDALAQADAAMYAAKAVRREARLAGSV
ncbi:diguanylate cyclase [Nocardioides sp.]|uniref:GGDEF domain-containing protein n=1 Tax=Nocardioides sp. TaxID=35761 RepID=UPI002720BCD4|nr:GGDEF domain-containing protein [Nocardioides sp.]MDO9456242.1 GGDEF domain-containing protein [Nocardioides sp.]